MANVLGELFSDIANAIRGKTGETGTMKPAEFPAKIEAIETGGASGDSGGSDTPIDSYYLSLAETMMTRNPEYLGSADTLELKSFKTSDGSTMANLREYAFAGFDDVVNMVFTDILYVEPNAFRGNVALKILDITVSDVLPFIVFDKDSLSECAALESVIIRSGGAGVTQANFSINGVGANDAFYVYVPAADYDTVVAAAAGNNSSVPANRYRKLEEYPAVDKWNENYTVNFYNGEMLIETKTVKHGQSVSCSYCPEGKKLLGWTPAPTNITADTDCYGAWVPETMAAATWQELVDIATAGKLLDVYVIGDEKDLTLNYADGTSETVTVALANGNCVMSADGATTANGVFFVKNPVTKSKYKMTEGFNKQANQYSGGVLDALRTTIKDALPAELAAAIKPYSNGFGGSIWIPKRNQITEGGYVPTGTISLLPLFNTQASRILYQHGTTTPLGWWINEYNNNSNFYFYYYISTDGSVKNDNNHSYPQHIAFGFCI